MPVRKADAVWEGTLKAGRGTMRFGDGAFEGTYSAGSRFEEEPGTNPEELIGAAHAGCFSMALSLLLEQAGFRAERIATHASVRIERVGEGHRITGIRLVTDARVPGIDQATFVAQAEAAKKGCPVSQALTGVDEITVEANLVD